MWETIRKNPTEDNLAKISNRVCTMIRFKLYPLISNLRQKKIINWYHFLIHNRRSGIPTTENDNNAYFHIRVALRKDVKSKDFRDSLPNYCVMTRKIERERVESISGINKSLLRNEEIEEAWRIIGEQSEWLINMLNIHKEDIEIPFQQIAQFLHFYANMTQLQVK